MSVLNELDKCLTKFSSSDKEDESFLKRLLNAPPARPTHKENERIRNNLQRKIRATLRSSKTAITCYKAKPTLIQSSHSSSEDEPLDLSISPIIKSKEDNFFLDELILKPSSSYDDLRTRMNELKQVMKIKKCFFIFRNLTPVLYSCVLCSPSSCLHEFNQIDLPLNRVLLKDITTFLEVMDYPFASPFHHSETKEFLRDEMKMNEYTNRYCSNLWLTPFFYQSVYNEIKIHENEFIEKGFFQKLNLSFYLEDRFGIAINYD